MAIRGCSASPDGPHENKSALNAVHGPQHQGQDDIARKHIRQGFRSRIVSEDTQADQNYEGSERADDQGSPPHPAPVCQLDASEIEQLNENVLGLMRSS